MSRNVSPKGNCGLRIANCGFEKRTIRNPKFEIRNARGFTLVEIMLVVIIISVLAAMVVPRFAGRREHAEIVRAKSDIAAIGLALDMYELDMGGYPKDIKFLLQNPGEGEEQWRGPYIRRGEKGLMDPWGNEYDYDPPTAEGQDYKLTSLGPDGKPGNDDITNLD